ncbi:MAG: histidine phosphatase family protein [Chordicoccus sp.]|jgi:broad specificity phosphatase PhoE
MKIWLIRHGQTKLNKTKKMQGLTDEPLSDKGRAQARAARENLEKLGGVSFDAVYASPLDRAIETASIVSGWDRKDIVTDRRLIEVNFGRYEGKKYYALGLPMTLYWALPEVFPAPKTVETIAQIRERSQSFLRELEKKDYENVLVAAHGGILRGLNGYMLDRPNGIRWRPKIRNCEMMVYESVGGKHTFLGDYKVDA